MGWTETCAVEERMRFVVAAQKQEESFAAVCRRFGVSRRVGYKWLARFEEEGAGVRELRGIDRSASRTRLSNAALRFAGRIRPGDRSRSAPFLRGSRARRNGPRPALSANCSIARD